MASVWPPGFPRIPPDDWVQGPVESLAVKYDSVERHGWYANLDPTVEELAAFLRPGDVVCDYSGGTGILIDRLLARLGTLPVGVVNVDASPKFLRLCLEKFRGEDRIAFRLLRYLKERRRLQHLDEALGPELVARGLDAVVSTNAIHLYYDLDDTLASWARCLRPGGRVLVQSGNIRSTLLPKHSWIIDGTVEAVNEAAMAIAREDPRFQAHTKVLDDLPAMAEYRRLREKYFLAPRPLDFYLGALRRAGLAVEGVRTKAIPCRVDEWTEFLAVYHEGILGWVGGVEKLTGQAPTEAAVRDRLELLRRGMERVFDGRDAFEATWTYITCVKPAA